MNPKNIPRCGQYGLVLFLEVVLWLGLAASWIAAQAAVPSLTLRMNNGPCWWRPPCLLCSRCPTSIGDTRPSDGSPTRPLESVLLYGVFIGLKFLLWRWALAALVVGWLDPKWEAGWKKWNRKAST